MSYRYDTRGKDQFEKDIKERTLKERELFHMWLDYLETQTGKKPSFTETGCGNDGEYLEDSDVSTAPDFNVDGFGHVEVKYSDPLITRCFHLKANQVKAYEKMGATVLMFNGCREEIPVFTMLKPEDLKEIIDSYPVINFQGFGGKPSYKIPVSEYIWRSVK